MFVKICGLTRPQDVRDAVAAGAQAIGFIAFPKSPRYVSPEDVEKLSKDIPRNILKVAVFVNEDPDVLREYLAVGIDVLQLHGSETAEYAKSLSAEAEIWRALRLKEESEIAEFIDFPCSRFVIDAYVKDAVVPGGTGHRADWSLSKSFVAASKVPVILAGGIKKESVKQAVAQVDPWGLDLSSGVELSPGVKSQEMIDAFFEELNS